MTAQSSSHQIPFWNWFLSLSLLQRYAILVWVLVMISFPIQIWVFTIEILPVSVTINVVTQALIVMIALFENWGWKRTGAVALIVVVLAWMVEALGSQTGFLFGGYDYTDRLSPQLLGVPVVIPLAWLMMLPPSWAIGKIIADKMTGRFAHWLVHGVFSGMAMTAWDFFLDPQMVHWGFWVWDHPDGFFGIPWSNYLGWLVVSTGITWIVRPDNLPVYPLVLIYTITMVLQAFGEAFFWSLPGPALAGLLAMGVFVILAVFFYGKGNEVR
jgi:putative membrane protein